MRGCTTIIGALLGHSQAATTQRYAQLSDDPLRSTADTVSTHIARAMRRDEYGEEEGAGVVALKRA
jgi:hypothetical protein